MDAAKPPAPIFDIGDHFDTTVRVGDRDVPIHIRRCSRTELKELRKQYRSLLPQRGAASLSEEDREQRDEARLAFTEQTIRDYISVDAGLLRDRGVDVTTGAQLVEMFAARADVLGEFMGAILVENGLETILVRKNLNSPRASEPGSAPSIPARGGDKQGSTAGNAASSESATSGPATEVSAAAAADGPSSSGGRQDDALKVH